jgi:hypothetical protein
MKLDLGVKYAKALAVYPVEDRGTLVIYKR